MANFLVCYSCGYQNRICCQAKNSNATKRQKHIAGLGKNPIILFFMCKDLQYSIYDKHGDKHGIRTSDFPVSNVPPDALLCLDVGRLEPSTRDTFMKICKMVKEGIEWRKVLSISAPPGWSVNSSVLWFAEVEVLRKQSIRHMSMPWQLQNNESLRPLNLQTWPTQHRYSRTKLSEDKETEVSPAKVYKIEFHGTGQLSKTRQVCTQVEKNSIYNWYCPFPSMTTCSVLLSHELWTFRTFHTLLFGNCCSAVNSVHAVIPGDSQIRELRRRFSFLQRSFYFSLQIFPR